MAKNSARGERTIAASEFFQGHFTTALTTTSASSKSACPRWIRRRDTRSRRWPAGTATSLVGVAATLALGADGRIADSRIALMGVADVPHRAAEAELVGAEPTAEAFAAAAQTATADLTPGSDIHGSAALPTTPRRASTVRRTLTTAAERAAR